MSITTRCLRSNSRCYTQACLIFALFALFPGFHSMSTEPGKELFFTNEGLEPITRAHLGENIVLTCEAGGKPVPFIHWLHKGRVINQVGGVICITDFLRICFDRVVMFHCSRSCCPAGAISRHLNCFKQPSYPQHNLSKNNISEKRHVIHVGYSIL